GLEGGRPGARGDVLFNGERLEWFPPLEFSDGDVVVLRVPGGGGFGPPEERDPQLVHRDLIDGLVTPEEARSTYGYTINAD
ncbi:MAG: hypothetical protein WD535_04095, partial [Thermaerobacterales bacterium]